MRRVILYLGLSLDGFIADKRGGVGWMEEGETPLPDPHYEALLTRIDRVVMGAVTYRQIITELSPGRWVYGGKQSYIVTHHPGRAGEGIAFTQEPPAVLIRRLRGEPGRDIWVLGGASLINQLIKADEIDEYQLTWLPVLLGEGIRLFSGENPPLKLCLQQSAEENGRLFCRYLRR